ncbi:MAG TPA: bifunctional adenosylcobinamide kinase/adenosylcobinamide-phosphate guanylyltransferase [Candidatus Dormibacteraeota bacterium]|nr:bifunctional adenosylcobinamide kinase/adenosylcobinamide-phosphate guanylyltransferase [Candidatus Dormibacteraeota bacterium]
MGYTLLTGGARSGKSAMAQRIALAAGPAVTVVVTAEARDEEMSDRIRRHRAERPAQWSTLEAPIDVLGAIRSARADDFVILDCLTLWVSNLLEAARDAADITATASRVARELAGRRAVVVTNEVGLGVVPANDLARRYVEVLGAVNACFADSAERALLMVAGRAIELAPP